jgi:hypothetical protein
MRIALSLKKVENNMRRISTFRGLGYRYARANDKGNVYVNALSSFYIAVGWSGLQF